MNKYSEMMSKIKVDETTRNRILANVENKPKKSYATLKLALSFSLVFALVIIVNPFARKSVSQDKSNAFDLPLTVEMSKGEYLINSLTINGNDYSIEKDDETGDMYVIINDEIIVNEDNLPLEDWNKQVEDYLNSK